MSKKKGNKVKAVVETAEATNEIQAFAGETIEYRSVRQPNGKFVNVLEDGTEYPTLKALKAEYPGATFTWVKKAKAVKVAA